MFCVIVTTRVGFDGISPSKHKQGYDIFSGTFPRSSTFKELTMSQMRATNTNILCIEF